jgi:hypothetical protein
MAQIYLDRADAKGYAKCYADIVDRHPTFENCVMLGDAYMQIDEV